MSTFVATRGVKLAIIGNPGVGKSALANSLAGKHMFDSRMSLDGKGVSKVLARGDFNGMIFLDMPGVADVKLRKEATDAISQAFKEGGVFQVVFVLDFNRGRVDETGLETMGLVVQAVDELKGQDKFGIVINQCHPAILAALDRESWFTNLAEGMSKNHCPSTRHMHFAPEIAGLVGAIATVVVPVGAETATFIQDLPKVTINAAKVRAVDSASSGETRVALKVEKKKCSAKDVSSSKLSKMQTEGDKAKNNSSWDSYAQFWKVQQIRDEVLQEWIDKCSDLGEEAYAEFDDFNKKMKDKMQSFRNDIFGETFASRQWKLLESLCSRDCYSERFSIIKQCPNPDCQMIWFNEGGCHHRRCGMSSDIDFGNKSAKQTPWKPLSACQAQAFNTPARRPCGYPFDWSAAKEVRNVIDLLKLDDDKIPKAVIEPLTMQRMLTKATAGVKRVLGNEAPF